MHESAAEKPVPLAGDGLYELAPRGVGRDDRQAALLEIVGRKHQGGVEIELEAALVREPENQFDPRAVRVEMGGKLVAYLSREHAREVHIVLAGRPRATCRAKIVGGWKREATYRADGTLKRDGSEGSFGVRLDLVLPAREAAEVTE